MSIFYSKRPNFFSENIPPSDRTIKLDKISKQVKIIGGFISPKLN
jgi:hypothetical protein